MGRQLAIALLPVLLAGCAGLVPREAPVQGRSERVELADVPFFPQRRYQCGPAALATVLAYSGIDTSADALVPEVYLPARKGSLQVELLAASRRHARVGYVIEPTLAALVAELDAGHPVLVLQNLGAVHLPIWHYAVVIGYDSGREQFILRSGSTRRELLHAGRFAGTWRRGGRWGMLSLRPGEIPGGAQPARYLESVAALETAGQTAAARTSYEAAAARWPGEPLAWFALGNRRLADGGAREAESAFARALELAPGDVAARNNRALLLARRGCRAEALAEIALAAQRAEHGPLEREVADSRRTIEATAPGICTP